MTLKHLAGISFTALALALSACGDQTQSSQSSVAVNQSNAKPIMGSFGIELANMDESVEPGDDFFRYVNGTWLKEKEIPSDRSRYGAFNILADKSETRVKEIIETAASKDNPGADEKRIGDFYNAYMDVDAIEAKDLKPLAKDILRIKQAKSHDDIISLMLDPELGLDSPVSPYVYIDAKQNDEYIVYLTQSGLGLPNRNAYFEKGEKAKGIRTAYVAYLAKMLEEAGRNNPEKRAKAVMAFEKKIAKGHWEPVKRRDRDAIYNKMTRAELNDLAPGLNFDLAFEKLGIGDQKTVIVREKSAVENAGKVFADAKLNVLKDYLVVSLLNNHSNFLPKRIDDATFDFYGKTLRGQDEQRPRWKRGVQAVNGTLGEVVGKVYVKKHFPEASKAQMDKLVENLRGAFKEGIDGLEWMGDETKEQAQYKLAKFNPKIGYPNKWEKYEGLNVDRSDLIGTIKSARAWGWQDELSQIGAPIDREEWAMNPQRVNAYYNSVLNEIVFPAAILDAPFFDPAADPAVNYGGIGAVIGHEMGHGFDDQGRKSDGDGVQRDWWTEADAEAYEKRASKLADQYSSFEPLPGEFLNGRLGLGENIGDLTGVTMAYNAYKKSLNGKEAPVIDGFTGDQRFFMAWAQVWAIKWKEEALSQQIKNGPHSPGEFRANGIVRNFQPWYDAFGVTEDHAMYIPPEKRVKIW